MNKRGQVTIFIIIAIVIIAAVLLVVLLRPKIFDMFMSEQRASQVLSSQVEPLRESIAKCTKETTMRFFNTIGDNGGYYKIETVHLLYFAGHEYVVDMYKDKNNARINQLPFLSGIESQYETFLQNEGYAEIDKCLNNFAGFKRVIDIEPGNRKITLDIKDETVTIKIDWPITISKPTFTKKITQTITQQDAELLVPFGRVWHVANDIINCEAQVDCKFEGITIDRYIWNNPDTMKYLSFYPRSIDENNIVWLLETIPYRAGEEVYRFYFGIQRET